MGLDVAQPPFVQYVKITGVYATVALDHRGAGALTVHGTAFRGMSQEHVDVIVKIADTDVLPFHEIVVIQRKGFGQKVGILYFRQRKICFFAVEAVQSRDKLKIAIGL